MIYIVTDYSGGQEARGEVKILQYKYSYSDMKHWVAVAQRSLV